MKDSDKKGYRQKLRDNFVRGDAASRTDSALLKLLLTYAFPRKEIESTTESLLSEFGSLSSLLESPLERLLEHNEISKRNAVLIKLVDWIRIHYGPKIREKRRYKAPPQASLFDEDSIKGVDRSSSEVIKSDAKKARPRSGTSMFGKAMLREAIEILPDLPDTESLEEVHAFLRDNLHFSAEQTRRRNAYYITRRMFPAGYADKPLLYFARAFPDSRELRDVCFYRFLKAEPLEVEIIEKLILPSMGAGRLNRENIRLLITEKYPDARSTKDCALAVVDALTAAEIVRSDRRKITFSYRDIPVKSFAFILHSEFPEPGMYDIRKIEENRLVRAMLWNPERILHALYELRNRRLISKVSEIDNIRQFSTKHKLADIVELILSRGKPS